ncbi:replication licensing factor Cdt1 [Chytriomyces hyalinus]|nr:replication licensing factor Cdt1 [Chytriomyces hyalinus]
MVGATTASKTPSGKSGAAASGRRNTSTPARRIASTRATSRKSTAAGAKTPSSVGHNKQTDLTDFFSSIAGSKGESGEILGKGKRVCIGPVSGTASLSEMSGLKLAGNPNTASLLRVKTADTPVNTDVMTPFMRAIAAASTSSSAHSVKAATHTAASSSATAGVMTPTKRKMLHSNSDDDDCNALDNSIRASIASRSALLNSGMPSTPKTPTSLRAILAVPPRTPKSPLPTKFTFAPVLTARAPAIPNHVARLPTHLQLLSKFFSALESTLAFHSTRDTPSTFHRIVKPVENICNRTFQMSHLAQILALLPGAYKLVPVRVLVDTDTGKKEDSVLIDMTVLDLGQSKDLAGVVAEEAVLEGKNKTSENDSDVAVASKTPAVGDKEKPFAETLEKRKVAFQEACREYVAAFHEDFLKTLKESDRVDFEALQKKVALAGSNLSSSVIPMPWHPHFDLESIPEVLGVTLPTTRSVAASEKLEALSRVSATPETTATESLPTESISAATDAPSRPLEETPNAGSSGTASDEPSSAITNEAEPPKKLSRAAALLERIREKERKRNESQLATPKYTPLEMKRRAMISRLPEVARSMMSYFAAAKKGSLPMKEVCEYVMTGVRSFISYDEAREHVILLSEICADWCTIVKLQVGTVVKVDVGVIDKIPQLQTKMKALLTAGSGGSGSLVGGGVVVGAAADKSNDLQAVSDASVDVRTVTRI